MKQLLDLLFVQDKFSFGIVWSDDPEFLVNHHHQFSGSADRRGDGCNCRSGRGCECRCWRESGVGIGVAVLNADAQPVSRGIIKTQNVFIFISISGSMKLTSLCGEGIIKELLGTWHLSLFKVNIRGRFASRSGSLIRRRVFVLQG